MTRPEPAPVVPQWVLAQIARWQQERKTGKMELNFHCGAIGSLQVNERITG